MNSERVGRIGKQTGSEFKAAGAMKLKEHGFGLSKVSCMRIGGMSV